MKKLFVTLALVGACVFTAYSQDYTSAIGLRLGYPTSISFKHFMTEKNAFEIFAGFRGYKYVRNTNIGALYQIHTPITGAPGLKWYFGGGAGVFISSYDKDFFLDNTYGNFNVGIMGNLGLDYKFINAPLNLSLDWVPTFIIGEAYYNGFIGSYGALSVRYTF